MSGSEWTTDDSFMEQCLSKVALLSWCVRAGVIDDSDPNASPRHHDPMFRHGSLSVELLRSLGCSGWAASWLNDLDRHPSVEAFRGVLDKLQTDADTPLPAD